MTMKAVAIIEKKLKALQKRIKRRAALQKKVEDGEVLNADQVVSLQSLVDNNIEFAVKEFENVLVEIKKECGDDDGSPSSPVEVLDDGTKDLDASSSSVKVVDAQVRSTGSVRNFWLDKPKRPITKDLVIGLNGAERRATISDDRSLGVNVVLSLTSERHIKEVAAAFSSSRHMPGILHMMYVDHGEKLILLQDGTVSLLELISEKPSMFFDWRIEKITSGKPIPSLRVLSFTAKMRSLVRQLIIIYSCIARNGCFTRSSMVATSIKFFRDDLSYDFPKILIQEPLGDPPETNVKLSGPIVSLPQFARILGQLVEEAKSAFKRIDPKSFTYVQIGCDVKDLIESLKKKQDIKHTINHPALWLTGETSAYMLFQAIEFSKTRAMLQIKADLLFLKTNKMLPQETLRYKDALPFPLDGSGTGDNAKYLNWKSDVKYFPPLSDFLIESENQKDTPPYENTWPGLIRFSRNVFPHFYEQRGKSENFNNRQGIRLEKIELYFHMLWPDFFIDIYRVLPHLPTTLVGVEAMFPSIFNPGS